jgi:predicted Zn-ribbon and HTH transcriptional regulator
MNESEVKKCPKCDGTMIKGSEQTLDDAFRCTRGGTEDPTKLEKFDFRIQPYYCESCGYIEFYKEMKEGVKP